MTMNVAILSKLSSLGTLSAADRNKIASLVEHIIPFRAGHNILHDGENPQSILTIMSGWAVKYKILKNNRRQIFGFMMPGDIAQLNAGTEIPLWYGIKALDHVSCCYIDVSRFEKTLSHHPAIRSAVRVANVMEEEQFHGALTRMGRSDACERLSHLFCEIWCRAAHADLINGDELYFPATQTDLADSLGLTSVHVNRVLQRLRLKGLIRFNNRILTIPNFYSLAESIGYK